MAQSSKSFTSFLAFKLLLGLFFSLLISHLFFPLPFRFAVEVPPISILIELFVCAIVDLDLQALRLPCSFLHFFHPLQGLPVVAALAADPQRLLVAGVLAEDLPILPLFK
jgi:hypothetical protein